MDIARRELLTATPAAGLMALLAGAATGAQARDGRAAPVTLRRIEEEARVRAVARAVIAQGWTATLITVDERGVPRGTPVYVAWPLPRLTIAVDRASGSLEHVRRRPLASLHFIRDGHDRPQGPFYLNIVGRAFVASADVAAERPRGTLADEPWRHGPAEQAHLRFQPDWLEVPGRKRTGARQEETGRAAVQSSQL